MQFHNVVDKPFFLSLCVEDRHMEGLTAVKELGDMG
jgi:hypothetical protein